METEGQACAVWDAEVGVWQTQSLDQSVAYGFFYIHHVVKKGADCCEKVLFVSDLGSFMDGSADRDHGW